MNIKLLAGAALALGLTTMAAMPAAAQAIFHIDFDAVGIASDVDAFLTVNSLANSQGTYDITSITGTVGGNNITGLVNNPGSPATSTSADGKFFYDNDVKFPGSPTLSNPGLLFTDILGNEQNLFSTGAGASAFYTLITQPGNYPTGVNGDFSVHLDSGTLAGGVPEPASWALMILGFGGVGATLRNTKRKTALAATA
jgi:type II secretory pathway pseudopilin PulG